MIVLKTCKDSRVPKLAFVFLLWLILVSNINVSFAATSQCVELTTLNLDYFKSPTSITWDSINNVWIVTERSGKIFELLPESGESRELISLSNDLVIGNHGGLLDLIIHPQYPTFPFVYITRTINDEDSIMFVVERYESVTTSLSLQNRKIVFRVILQSTNNVGGSLEFDENGYLLVSVGDGSKDFDLQKNAPNPHTFPGSIIRLDISKVSDKDNDSLTPPNNPFTVFLDGAPDVYAFGIRSGDNLYRDKATNNIFFVDNGVFSKEINRLQSKGYYGWSCYDGNSKLKDSNGVCADTGVTFSNKVNLVFPSQQIGQIVGGIVYRGQLQRNWFTKYFFADSITGRIWNVDVSLGNVLQPESINLIYQGQTGGTIVPISMAADSEEEMVLLDGQGRVLLMSQRDCDIPEGVIKDRINE